MATQNPKNMPEGKKALIRTILTLSGFFFAALGAACLIMPQGFNEIIGQDKSNIAQILGAAFILVGLSDVAIAQIIFKGSTKHD